MEGNILKGGYLLRIHGLSDTKNRSLKMSGNWEIPRICKGINIMIILRYSQPPGRVAQSITPEIGRTVPNFWE